MTVCVQAAALEPLYLRPFGRFRWRAPAGLRGYILWQTPTRGAGQRCRRAAWRPTTKYSSGRVCILYISGAALQKNLLLAVLFCLLFFNGSQDLPLVKLIHPVFRYQVQSAVYGAKRLLKFARP